MARSLGGPWIKRNGLWLSADFANRKCLTGGLGFKDIINGIPFEIQNPGSVAHIAIANGYVEFSPTADNTDATLGHYRMNDARWDSNRDEMSWESVQMVTAGASTWQHNSGLSPRATESGSPVGYGIGSGVIAAEIHYNLSLIHI